MKNKTIDIQISLFGPDSKEGEEKQNMILIRRWVQEGSGERHYEESFQESIEPDKFEQFSEVDSKKLAEDILNVDFDLAKLAQDTKNTVHGPAKFENGTLQAGEKHSEETKTEIAPELVQEPAQEALEVVEQAMEELKPIEEPKLGLWKRLVGSIMGLSKTEMQKIAEERSKKTETTETKVEENSRIPEEIQNLDDLDEMSDEEYSLRRKEGRLVTELKPQGEVSDDYQEIIREGKPRRGQKAWTPAEKRSILLKVSEHNDLSVFIDNDFCMSSLGRSAKACENQVLQNLLLHISILMGHHVAAQDIKEAMGVMEEQWGEHALEWIIVQRNINQKGRTNVDVVTEKIEEFWRGPKGKQNEKMTKRWYQDNMREKMREAKLVEERRNVLTNM